MNNNEDSLLLFCIANSYRRKGTGASTLFNQSTAWFESIHQPACSVLPSRFVRYGSALQFQEPAGLGYS